MIRFALGELAYDDGKFLAQLVQPIPPLPSNVGLIGLSNGGNATITVADVYGTEISSLAWIVNFESPVGDGMPTLEASSKNRGRNPTVYPAYNPDSGEFDLSLVTYDDKVLNYQKKLSRHLESVSGETPKKFILNLFDDSIDRKIKNIIGRLNYCFENNVIFCNRET